MTPSEIAAVDAIPGWLALSEASALYDAASRATVVVELGSWKGRSTAALALASKGRGRVYAVDHWCGSADERTSTHREAVDGLPFAVYRQFLANLSRLDVLGDPVIPVVSDHVAAAAVVREPVDLLFVDGEHTERAVLEQLAAWRPRLAAGATVMFHDSHFPEVARAIAGLHITVTTVKSLAIWRLE